MKRKSSDRATVRLIFISGICQYPRHNLCTVVKMNTLNQTFNHSLKGEQSFPFETQKSSGSFCSICFPTKIIFSVQQKCLSLKNASMPCLQVLRLCKNIFLKSQTLSKRNPTCNMLYRATVAASQQI